MDPLLFWSNGNLEVLVFVEKGKPENPRENPQRTDKKLMALARNQTQATLAGTSVLTVVTQSLLSTYIIL